MNICWFEYASWLPRAHVMSGDWLVHWQGMLSAGCLCCPGCSARVRSVGDIIQQEQNRMMFTHSVCPGGVLGAARL